MLPYQNQNEIYCQVGFYTNEEFVLVRWSLKYTITQNIKR